MDDIQEPLNEHGTDLGAGIAAFFGGIGFILFTPRAWPFAAVPVVILLVLFCGGFALELWGLWEYSRTWAEASETSTQVGAWAVRLVGALVAMALALLVGLGLAQPLSGFALERIAQLQEEQLTGRRGGEIGFFHSLVLALKVALVTVTLAILLLGSLLVVGFLFPPALLVTVPLKLFVTAWLLAWDFVDYPLSLRGYGLRQRFHWVLRNFSAYTTFGLTWAAVLLIPGVALLVLPMGVAGAARLVVQSGERSDLR